MRAHEPRWWTDTSSASADPCLLSTTPALMSRSVVAVSDGWPCTTSLISPVTHHCPGSTFLSPQVPTHFITLSHYNKAQITDSWPRGMCACVCVRAHMHACVLHHKTWLVVHRYIIFCAYLIQWINTIRSTFSVWNLFWTSGKLPLLKFCDEMGYSRKSAQINQVVSLSSPFQFGLIHPSHGPPLHSTSSHAFYSIIAICLCFT